MSFVTRSCLLGGLLSVLFACSSNQEREQKKNFSPAFKLIKTNPIQFNSFVDCNMAEAWVGDTFRIFPGKYGEDPLWGNARDLKFADGPNAEATFRNKAEAFTEPTLPKNAPVRQPGLHGAIWFETVYQAKADSSGRTLYAVYHNENYPSTLPYDARTGEGYQTKDWPEGIKEPGSMAAVCRIGIMKSTDGGRSWTNRGLFLEDKQPRMILRKHNTGNTFAGGVGDPSAVVSGDYLYLFYGEYGYPGTYQAATYDPQLERRGQCISVARIRLADLDGPQGKARRWDGKAFTVPFDGVGKPVASLQIPEAAGGGPTSSPKAGYHWGPSVSWNTHLNAWVMLMAKATGPSWAGSSIYIAFNPHADLGEALNSQDWTQPKQLLDRPGSFLWYPSLQPTTTPDDIKNRYTCLRLGQRARLFVKDIQPKQSQYLSEYVIEFE